jgi:hypothetical protein
MVFKLTKFLQLAPNLLKKTKRVIPSVPTKRIIKAPKKPTFIKKSVRAGLGTSILGAGIGLGGLGIGRGVTKVKEAFTGDIGQAQDIKEKELDLQFLQLPNISDNGNGLMTGDGYVGGNGFIGEEEKGISPLGIGVGVISLATLGFFMIKKKSKKRN